MSAVDTKNLDFVEYTMNSTDFLQILKDNLKQSVQNLALTSSESARVVKEWLLYNTLKS